MRKPDRDLFFQRVETVFDGVPLTELSEDDLISRLSVAQHASDMALLEVEKRGLVEFYDGVPAIPYVLPEGVDPIETVLTRPRKAR
jgi:hypothetical protein